MRRMILDAYAILAWMQKETGCQAVRGLFAEAEQGRAELYLSYVNAGEVYYRLYKTAGPETADNFREALLRGKFPLNLVAAGNSRVWRASLLKGRHRISYADAFAIELAIDKSGQLVTGDPEILALANEGVIDLCDLTVVGN